MITHIEGVLLSRIAEQVDTPCYVYSDAALAAAATEIHRAFNKGSVFAAYAVKANANLALLVRIAELGFGADVVSGGELLRARAAGFSGNQIVYSGVGKRRNEIDLAVREKIRCIHIECLGEIELIAEAAERSGGVQDVGIRINPNVDPVTHAYISTGLHETKFGLETDEALQAVERIAAQPSLRLTTVASHIGSQIGDVRALRESAFLTATLAGELRARGLPVSVVDVGGGWPIAYGAPDETRQPSIAECAAAIYEGLNAAGALEFELGLEPGRALIGKAGSLLTRVLYTKSRGQKHIAIVDAAMTELIRPALYEAFHSIRCVGEDNGSPVESVETDVVGPVCETGDFLARARMLPKLAPGDLVLVGDVGAYGASMASHYNARARVAEVLISGDLAHVIRETEPVEQLWAQDQRQPRPLAS